MLKKINFFTMLELTIFYSIESCHLRKDGVTYTVNYIVNNIHTCTCVSFKILTDLIQTTATWFNSNISLSLYFVDCCIVLCVEECALMR